MAARKREAAIDILQGGLDVQRVGRTYVLRLTYESPDPRSPPISRPHSGTLHRSTRRCLRPNAKYTATRRASTWLRTHRRASPAVLRRRPRRPEIPQRERPLADGHGPRVPAAAQRDQHPADGGASPDGPVQGAARPDRADHQGRAHRRPRQRRARQHDDHQLRAKYLDAARRQSEIRQQARTGPYPSRAPTCRNAGIRAADLRRATSHRGELSQHLRRFAGARALAGGEPVGGDGRQRRRQHAAGSPARTGARGGSLSRPLRRLPVPALPADGQQQSFPITDARVISAAQVPDKPSRRARRWSSPCSR